MCWVGKAGMLRKLTSTAVLTGLPMGTGAVGQSKALNPMAAGEEQNRSKVKGQQQCKYHSQIKPEEILLDAGVQKEGLFPEQGDPTLPLSAQGCPLSQSNYL